MAETKKVFPMMEFPLSMKRQDAFPIDIKSLYDDKAAADTYAAQDPTAYEGMPISVVTGGVATLYIVENKKLKQVGKPVKVDDVTLVKKADGETLEIKGFSAVSKAGLVLRTKAKEGGGFELEWAETKDATVDDLVKRLTAVEKELPEKAAKVHKHAATDITEDATHKFTTEAKQKEWDNKATPEQVDEKIKAIPVADKTKNGLMSSAMVTNHEKMAQDLAQAKTDLTEVKDKGNINYHIASDKILGAVKIGKNITVGADGTISTHDPYVLPETIPANKIAQDATHRFTTDVEKASYADKYTKAEIDNKFSTYETATQWKASVNTYADIAKTYPKPQDGWTVNVNDTDITYRYTGTEWIAISANAIPKATQEVDGKMSKEDKTKLDGIAEGANNYVHPEHHNADVITQDPNHRFLTDTKIAEYDAGVKTANAANATAEQNKKDITAANGKISAIETKIRLMTVAEAQAIIDKYKTKK